MRLTKDIVLLIAIDNFTSIYELSKTICSRQRKMVEKYHNLSETELIDLIQTQSDIYDRLLGKGDVKNNVK